MMLDDDWWSWKSVWVIKNEFFVYFSCLEKYPKYEAWIWTLYLDLKTKWHIYMGHKWSEVVLKTGQKIALCAGGPALDDRWRTSAHAHFCKGAGRHALTQAPVQWSQTGRSALVALRWCGPAHDQRHATGRFTPVSYVGRLALVDQRTAHNFEPHKQSCKGNKGKLRCILKA